MAASAGDIEQWRGKRSGEAAAAAKV